MKNKLCISIRSLKRADYLERCLTSLEQNSDLTGVDFFFFQDGAKNKYSGKKHATKKEVEESLQVFKNNTFRNKTIYISRENVGPIRRNEIMLDYLFPQYEYAVLADNDLVFNKYYIKTLKILFKQFKNDPKAGIIQTSFRHDGNCQNREEAEKLKNKVAYGFSHFWEMGFWKDSWKKIEPYMKPYFDLTKECDFYELLYNSNKYEKIRKKLYKVYGKFHKTTLTTTEDYALVKSATMAGYRGVHTLTLRHRSIGERGHYSFRGNRWTVQGFGNIRLYDVGRSVRKYKLI